MEKKWTWKECSEEKSVSNSAANITEDVARWVHTTQNPLMVQVQNTVTAPQLQASNNIQQSVFSYDSATRIPEIPNAPPREYHWIISFW